MRAVCLDREGSSLTPFSPGDFRKSQHFSPLLTFSLTPELFPRSPWLHSRGPHVISAGIHPHFQGTGFEALPLHFSKPFPWSSESVWLGLGSVKWGLPPPAPPFVVPPSTPPLFPLLYIELSVQSTAISWNCLDGVLSPIKATEPTSGPASGVCQNSNRLWRRLFPPGRL